MLQHVAFVVDWLCYNTAGKHHSNKVRFNFVKGRLNPDVPMAHLEKNANS